MTVRARGAAADPEGRPLYSRVLRLRHVQPSGLLRFIFLEGMIFLAVLLSLAELVSWWSVLVLPLAVATIVKLNDVFAGLIARAISHQPFRARSAVGRATARVSMPIGNPDELPVAGRGLRRRPPEPSSAAPPTAGRAAMPAWTAVTGREPGGQAINGPEPIGPRVINPEVVGPWVAAERKDVLPIKRTEPEPPYGAADGQPASSANRIATPPADPPFGATTRATAEAPATAFQSPVHGPTRPYQALTELASPQMYGGPGTITGRPSVQGKSGTPDYDAVDQELSTSETDPA